MLLPQQFLSVSVSRSRVIAAERNQIPVGRHVLNDAAPQAPEIVSAGVHKMHARHEHSVETPPEPVGGPPARLVFPPVQATQQTLKRQSLGSFALVEAS